MRDRDERHVPWWPVVVWLWRGVDRGDQRACFSFSHDARRDQKTFAASEFEGQKRLFKTGKETLVAVFGRGVQGRFDSYCFGKSVALVVRNEEFQLL